MVSDSTAAGLGGYRLSHSLAPLVLDQARTQRPSFPQIVRSVDSHGPISVNCLMKIFPSAHSPSWTRSKGKRSVAATNLRWPLVRLRGCRCSERFIPFSRWGWGTSWLKCRQEFFDPFHRNDGELVAHSGLLIPLETDTPYTWLEDRAMVRSCLQMLLSCHSL